MILLGWEIGTGARIEIPDTGHLAWFGQTQLSGKTTALEAIAFRGGLKAIAFITKQGEGGFLTGRMIPPYFSEPTNDEEQPLWRWVKSILEASQQRRMNFEESWIIRACEDPRPAKTLADVHENIKSLLAGEKGERYTGKRKGAKTETKWIRKPVSGMNAGIYTSLKAYFDIVMPQLARLPYTKKLELFPGLNVMDLRHYAMETQALVIRSVMEWVYLHEKGVRVIVPEAQDFVPQGKNSPVKMACETLVRKAGANKNFMWLDSQDMAAVDKIMLRACSIVGIGVQTEMHEIDRSLAGLFTPALKPIDIARLKIGEFFVRTSEAKVSKVYVQPAWMDSELHAQAIARGEETTASARPLLTAFKHSREKDEKNKSRKATELEILQGAGSGRSEDPMRIPVAVPVPHSDSGSASAFDGDPDHGERIEKSAAASAGSSASDHGRPGSTDSNSATQKKESEEVMSTDVTDDVLIERIREKYLSGDLIAFPRTQLEKDFAFLFKQYDRLVTAHDALAARPAAAPANGGNGLSLSAPQLDYIYKYVKAHAAKDPGILELLVSAPTMRVKVDRPVIRAHGDNLDGRMALLIRDGFFDKPRTRADVGAELRRRGALAQSANLKILSPFLAKLTTAGFLTNEAEGFKANPEMKVEIDR